MNATATKTGNIRKALSEPRTRMVFFIGLALALVIMLVAWVVLVRQGNRAHQELQSSIATPPSLQQAGGAPQTATPEYDRLLAAGNAQQADEAMKTGDSAVPIPRTGVEQAPVTMAPQPIAAATPTPPPETSPSAQASRSGADQARAAAIQARAAAMQQQMSKLQSYWAVQPHASMLVAQGATEKAVDGASAASTATGTGQGSGDPTEVVTPDIRMGDMLYATLDYAIDTDDPTPAIQATIRQPGRFNGARVLGEVQAGDQYAKTVGLHFTRMMVPGEPKARTIDAWAVDPTRDRPSIASDVNHHYISRGMSLFIGSFLSGYADALIAGGQTERVISDNNTTTVQRDAYTNRQLAQIGIGNVGKTASQEFATGANRKPTVRVDAGVDMGIWFVEDVTSAVGN